MTFKCHVALALLLAPSVLMTQSGFCTTGDATAQTFHFSGTGVSSESYVEPGFDFSMRYPLKWLLKQLDMRERLGGPKIRLMKDEAPFSAPCLGSCKTVRVANSSEVSDASQESMVAVTFMTDFPATSLADLRDKLKSIESSSTAWVALSDERYAAGFTSGEQPEKGTPAFRAVDYHLLGAGQVVRVESRAHPAQNGTWSVAQIKASIDKASKPPRILRIESEPRASKIVPGSEACLRMDVEDVRDNVTEKSITIFAIRGAPANWTRFRIEQLERGKLKYDRFRLCTTVTTAFDATGLEPIEVKLENAVGVSMECNLKDNRLHCPTQSEQPTQQIARVENPQPQLFGPRVCGITWTAGTGLSIDASDPAGLEFGEVYLSNGKSRILYPDMLNDSLISIDLSRKSSWGQNVVQAVVLYNKNGLHTRLVAQPGNSHYVMQSNGKLHDCGKSIPVVTFLSNRAKAKLRNHR